MFERTEQWLATIGLFFSGLAFALGVAGLLYVAVNVMSTSPPSLGSQGEWLYGAIPCLIVAGWGFAQAAKFAVRLRSTQSPPSDARAPKIRIGSQGLSIDLPPLPHSNGTAKPSGGGFTWSFSTSPTPITTFKLDEEQLAAAERAAGAGSDWDTVCRQINPEYERLSDTERGFYRHAIESVVQDRRRTPRT